MMKRTKKKWKVRKKMKQKWNLKRNKKNPTLPGTEDLKEKKEKIES